MNSEKDLGILRQLLHREQAFFDVEEQQAKFSKTNLFDSIKKLIFETRKVFSLHLSIIEETKTGDLFQFPDLTIPSNAFKECQNLINITLASKSTLMISEENFLNMGYLEKIKMSGNKIIIQDNCFNKCINISSNDSYQQYSSNKSLILKSDTNRRFLVKSCYDCCTLLHKSNPI